MTFCSFSIYLVAFCLGSLTVNSFGELYMIHQRPLREGDAYNLTCISKDHSTALVWNDDLRDPVQPEDPVLNQPLITSCCVFAEPDNCNVGCGKNRGWEVVDSVTYPMGPVFDFRWKKFSQISFPRDDPENKYQYVRNVSESGTVVFSVRGLGDINVRLCEKNITSSNNSCFWITIPAWPNTALIIRSCVYGEADDEELSQRLCDNQSYFEPSSRWTINASEWRTYILKWETNQMEIKSSSTDESSFQKLFNISRSVSRLFVQSSDVGHIRFHFYNYLLTTQKNAVLSSDPFTKRNSNTCFELVVNLCNECKLEVYLTKSFDQHRGKHQKIGEISRDEDATYRKLSPWQVVKLKTIWYRFRGDVSISFIPILESSGRQGWWAIDSLRECQSAGGVQAITRAFPGLWNSTSPSLPVIGCQQLSYSENVVISSNAQIIQNISTKVDCGRRWVGPTCGFPCTDSCNGTSICDQSGCICAPGFGGSDCMECSDGHYGHNCQETCGFCKSVNCDKVTGSCGLECEDHYLPSNCKTKLGAPVVSDIEATTASLKYPELDAKEAHDISFEIKTETGQWSRILTFRVTSITIWMYGVKITELLPGTLYWLRAVVTTTQDTIVNSPETKFTTICKPSSIPWKFSVISGENGIIWLIFYQPPHYSPEITTIGVIVYWFRTRLRNIQPLNSLKSQYYEVQRLNFTHRYVKFYLPTSTEYLLCVQAISSCGHSDWIPRYHRVPASLGFNSEKNLEVKQDENFMRLKLPSVINETWNTVMRIVVKGSPICTGSAVPGDVRKRVNMATSEEGWIARIFKGPGERPEHFIIGKDSTDDSSKNCPLHFEKTYVVVVDVVDTVDGVSAVITSFPIYLTSKYIGTEVITAAKKPEKLNLLWFIIPIILLICILLFLICQRKCSNALRSEHGQNIVSYSQIFTDFIKSATTCTSQQPPPFAIPREAGLYNNETASTSGTVTWSRYSRIINIQDFEDYVKASIASGLLKSQFQMLPKGINKPCKHGALPQNKHKNRYTDIIPYDSSRVILKKTPGNSHSNYINANYIQGFRNKKTYIATQGPKPETVVDFWRMIWQEEALIICMLANVVEGSRVKCEQYWPEFGASHTYGDIVVITENNHVFGDYTFRTLLVSCKGESRKIEHMHFTGWPDHTVPMYPNSVIAYLKKLQTVPIGKGPIIVHCSAGVGRTGTIILCDICLRQALTTGTVDVLAEFKKIRDSRLNMIDNVRQYIFVHVVLTECFESSATDLKCNNDLPHEIENFKKQLPKHIERLRNTVWQDQALHPQMSSRTPFPSQLAKNRFPELAPDNTRLIYLDRYPRHDNNSDYISAVTVDGLRIERQYLASQLPLPSTLSDFWRLIAEHRIELVIVLQLPDLDDPTCCDIIPGEEPVNPVPFISVKLNTSTDYGKCPYIKELVLTDTSRVAARTQQVTFLTCPEWGLGKNGKPPPPKKLIELWMSSEYIQRETRPTLVLCHDGITGCGLYLALSFLLERMASERICDIIFAVRVIRQSRPNFVQSQEQFEYLCDAAVKYIESFETYANLT